MGGTILMGNLPRGVIVSIKRKLSCLERDRVRSPWPGIASWARRRSRRLSPGQGSGMLTLDPGLARLR